MSWWDVVVVLIIALALLRGYQIGLGRRLTGWVGGFLVFFAVWFNYSLFHKLFRSWLDGESFVENRLLDYLQMRYPPSNPLSDGRLIELVESLPLGHSASQEALRAIESTGNGLREQMLEQVASILAPAIWQVIFFIILIIFGHILLAFFGQILAVLLRRVQILELIDRYAGAFFSAVLGVALVTLLSVVLMTFSPLGVVHQALQDSYFAGALQDVFRLFIQRGVY